jgi:hypothetical protein
MKTVPAILPFALAACATAVHHPDKSEAEMHADIERCSAEAKAIFSIDPLLTLDRAYRCLDALGYKRDRPGLGTGMRDALARPEPVTPPQSCRVPCR